MSYVPGWTYYTNVTPVAFFNERYSPIPGWGMHPNQAGARHIAVGGLGGDALGWTGTATVDIPGVGKKAVKIDVPLEQMAKDAIASSWPAIEPKLLALGPKLASAFAPKMDAAGAKMEAELKKAKTGVLILGAVIVGSVWLSAAWVKTGK